MAIEKKFKGENILPLTVHPANILLEMFDYDSVTNVQKALNCSEEFYHKFMSRDPETGLSRAMCLRLAHYSGTSYEFWYNLQKRYDHTYMLAHEETIVSTLPKTHRQEE